MKQLFEPITLPHLTLKNRLVRSATWEAVAAPNGAIAENAYQIYDELARGGVGLIISGFTSVADNDHYFGGMMRLSNDVLIPSYKKLTDTVHQHNCPIIAQLALGAYYKDDLQIEPDEMLATDIQAVVDLFVRAAQRAQKASFDGVQIHAAHFFFLSRFISPLVNHRTDNYGGSNRKRAQILLDILSGIRHACPTLHVTMKINSSDFSLGGLTEQDSLEICQLLAKNGLDSVEVSGNGTSVAGIVAHQNEGYFVPFAAQLAQEVDIPVMVVGGLRSKEVMEKVLNQTDIALLSISRPLLCEPDFPHKLQQGISTVSKCVSCNACYRSKEHKCVFRTREQAQ